MRFKNRQDGGRQLADKIRPHVLGDMKNVIVLGIPRGGVITGYEVAKALDVPFDIVVARKIGAPGNQEFAIGAVAEDTTILPPIEGMGESLERYVRAAAEKETETVKKRLRLYRSGRQALDLGGKTAIIVDDGIATGLTARAAIASVRRKGAAKVIVATPVMGKDVLGKLTKDADQVIAVTAPASFEAVGLFYEHFDQTRDEEVVALMKQVS